MTDLPVFPPSPAWLEARRAAGRAAWAAAGPPGRGVEDWRWTHTALAAALKQAGGTPEAATSAAPVSLDQVPAGSLDLDDAPRLVLVNGRLSPTLSAPTLSAPTLPTGVSVQTLAAALAADPAGLASLLGAHLPVEPLPFAALNAGAMDDALVVRIAPGATVTTPLHLVWVSVHAGSDPGAPAPALILPRLLVVVGRGAEATLAESHLGTGAGPTTTSAAAEIVLEDGARLHHVVLQNAPADALHLAATQVVAGRGALYDSFRLGLGARLARTDLRLAFTGEGAEARLDGAYALMPGQHHDTASVIEHAVPRCTSHQTYKGVVDAKARGVFQGRIEIARHAQHSAGHQLHKALLLDRGAEVDTKPELLIYADDVQCSHGAAAGALDEDALFYLRARGVDEAAARTLLIEGFLDDVIDTVTAEAPRAALRAAVAGWLDRRKAVREAA